MGRRSIGQFGSRNVFFACAIFYGSARKVLPGPKATPHGQRRSERSSKTGEIQKIHSRGIGRETTSARTHVDARCHRGHGPKRSVCSFWIRGHSGLLPVHGWHPLDTGGAPCSLCGPPGYIGSVDRRRDGSCATPCPSDPGNRDLGSDRGPSRGRGRPLDRGTLSHPIP